MHVMPLNWIRLGDLQRSFSYDAGHAYANMGRRFFQAEAAHFFGDALYDQFRGHTVHRIAMSDLPD